MSLESKRVLGKLPNIDTEESAQAVARELAIQVERLEAERDQKPRAAPSPKERRRLPETRDSITRKITIHYHDQDGKAAELDIYITVGLYEDGTPGEVFLKADRMGSTISGLLDTVSMCMSLALQFGTPLSALTSKLVRMKFEPSGTVTSDPALRNANSIVDVIGRWLDIRFGERE